MAVPCSLRRQLTVNVGQWQRCFCLGALSGSCFVMYKEEENVTCVYLYTRSLVMVLAMLWPSGSYSPCASGWQLLSHAHLWLRYLLYFMCPGAWLLVCALSVSSVRPLRPFCSVRLSQGDPLFPLCTHSLCAALWTCSCVSYTNHRAHIHVCSPMGMLSDPFDPRRTVAT